MKKQLLSLFLLSTLYSFGQAIRLTDINSGTALTDIYGLTEYNGKLYFSASDGTNGNELWSWDGTTAAMVSDINPNGDSYPFDYCVFKNKLVFAAQDGTSGFEIWQYDGINPPTMVADIDQVSNGGALYNGAQFFEHNGTLFFRASNGIDGIELWAWDGTNSPYMYADINTGTGQSSAPQYFMNFLGDLHFVANNPNTGKGSIYSCDGINPPIVVSDTITVAAYQPIVFQNEVFFAGSIDSANYTVEYGIELFTYDGTNIPILHTDIDTGTHTSLGVTYPNNSYPIMLREFQGKLYFNVDIMGYETWVYDGANSPRYANELEVTSSTVTMFKGGSGIFNNRLYFSTNTATYGRELFMYDGFNQATLVMDINPSGDGKPREFTEFNGELYFFADDENYGDELWKLDPTSSVSEISEQEIFIHPNPTSGILNLDIDYDIDALEVYNLTGQRVMQFAQPSNTIDVSELPQGVYTLKLLTSNGVSTAQFIKS